MAHVIVDRRTITAKRSETIIFAFAACGALGIEAPTAQMVKWIDHLVPGEYNNDPLYWQPYGFLPNQLTAFIHPWARGAFGYFATMAGIKAEDKRDISMVDPLDWYANILERVAAYEPDNRTLGAARLAYEQTSPSDQYLGEMLTDFYTRVRASADHQTLITTAGALKRAWARIASEDAKRQAQLNRDLERGGFR